MDLEMYPYKLEIDGARANDDQHWRIDRIHLIIGYAQALADFDKNEDYYKKIKSIYDYKGNLTVTWNTEPTENEKQYLQKAWESIVTDYESGIIGHEII
jgi:predicted transglutaminase-like protease